MENISKTLEEWGSWVANDQDAVNILNNDKKEVIPDRIKLRKKCTHHNANVINDLMKRLMAYNKEDYQLIIMFLVKRLYSLQNMINVLIHILVKS